MILFGTAEVAVMAEPAAESTVVARPSPLVTWRSRHEEFVRRARSGQSHVFFLGDSLTEFWTSTGVPHWSRHFAPLKAACFGMAGDKVQNLLFRVTHGELDARDAKLYVVTIGTCNLADSPPNAPEDVVKGIAAVIDAIRRKHPDAKVILQSILPNGPDATSGLRRSIVETNRLLASHEFPQNVSFLSIHDEFLAPNGTLRRGLFIDGTHLTLQGYQLWAQLLMRHVTDALEAPALP